MIDMVDPIQIIRQFILDGHGGAVHFGDSDDLIESGLIDSLRFVEFVLLIMELSGKTVNMDDLDIDAFRSIEFIMAAFFADKRVERGGRLS